MTRLNRSCKFACLLLICLALSVIFSCSTQENDPIKIGFMGTLSGHTAVVGDACRDSVILAVEQTNQSGGIAGRKIELKIRDIRQDPEIVQKTVNEFISQNVPVVVGPMFSSMSVVAATAVDNKDILLISPTSSTTLLNDKDDNFFRLYPPSNVAAEKLADHVYGKSLQRVSIVWDMNNRAFTEDWKNYFVKRFASQGGAVIDSIGYEHKDIHYIEIIKDILEKEPEAILILSNAYETAMFCQQLQKLKSTIPIFASEWSMTEGLIEMGGHAVEGIEFFHVLNASSTDKAYLNFVEAHKARYKIPPSYPAILAYDAVQVAIEGLKQGARTGQELKKILLQQKSIKTLQTTIQFDQNGEVTRELFLNTVKDGKIVSIHGFSPLSD